MDINYTPVTAWSLLCSPFNTHNHPFPHPDNLEVKIVLYLNPEGTQYHEINCTKNGGSLPLSLFNPKDDASGETLTQKNTVVTIFGTVGAFKNQEYNKLAYSFTNTPPNDALCDHFLATQKHLIPRLKTLLVTKDLTTPAPFQEPQKPIQPFPPFKKELHLKYRHCTGCRRYFEDGVENRCGCKVELSELMDYLVADKHYSDLMKTFNQENLEYPYQRQLCEQKYQFQCRTRIEEHETNIKRIKTLSPLHLQVGDINHINDNPSHMYCALGIVSKSVPSQTNNAGEVVIEAVRPKIALSQTMTTNMFTSHLIKVQPGHLVLPEVGGIYFIFATSGGDYIMHREIVPPTTFIRACGAQDGRFAMGLIDQPEFPVCAEELLSKLFDFHRQQMSKKFQPIITSKYRKFLLDFEALEKLNVHHAQLAATTAGLVSTPLKSLKKVLGGGGSGSDDDYDHESDSNTSSDTLSSQSESVDGDEDEDDENPVGFHKDSSLPNIEKFLSKIKSVATALDLVEWIPYIIFGSVSIVAGGGYYSYKYWTRG